MQTLHEDKLEAPEFELKLNNTLVHVYKLLLCKLYFYLAVKQHMRRKLYLTRFICMATPLKRPGGYPVGWCSVSSRKLEVIGSVGVVTGMVGLYNNSNKGVLFCLSTVNAAF